MEVLETVYEKKIPHKHPLTAMIWTNEEGSLYPPAMMISGVVCYDYLPEDIRQKFKYEDMMASKSILDPTKTFGEALEKSGFKGDKKYRLSPDRYKYMFETYIEQGPILEDAGNDIRVVDCVLGMFNYRLKFYGQTTHAGTFPMPKRRDAFYASTGLDALTHAVEAYTSKQAQPLTDALALSAVKRIFKYLPIAYADGENETARYEMSIAALEAGICINNSSVTIVHGMSRPIGALFHVPHGLSNAMLLCKCMDFAKDGAAERFAQLSRAVGTADAADSDETAADKFIDGLFDICRKCEVPTIADYGIDIDKFIAAIPQMTADALASGSPANTRKSVGADDISAIYKALI